MCARDKEGGEKGREGLSGRQGAVNGGHRLSAGFCRPLSALYTLSRGARSPQTYLSSFRLHADWPQAAQWLWALFSKEITPRRN